MQNRRGLSCRLKTFLSLNLRRIGTGFSFLVFGLGALDLAFVVLPIIVISTSDAEVRRVRIQKAISLNFRLFLMLIQRLGLMTLKVDGIERLREDRGVLVIANHPTLIDVVVLMAFLPEVDCVVKEGLKQNPFLHRIVKMAGYIINSDPRSLIADCQDRLEQGRNLIIFPEGTRTLPGSKPRFQRGVARVAIQSECPIRPVYLDCSPGTLAKGQRWYDIPERPFVFKVRVGELIETASWQDRPLIAGVGSRKLTQYLEQHYSQAAA